MKKLLMVLMCSFIISISGFAKSEEVISSVFGIYLGQVFNLSEAIDTKILPDGTPIYQFNPKGEFLPSTKHYVLVTPRTHRVHSIWEIINVEDVDGLKHIKLEEM